MNIFQKTECKLNTVINKKVKLNDLNKFQFMHKVVESKLSNYLNDFRKGNFDDLYENFTEEQYRKFGVLLENGGIYNNKLLKSFKYIPPTFDSYRNSFHRLLDGINLSAYNAKILTDISNDYKYAYSILKDPKKLKDYFEEKFGAKYTLSENIVEIEPLELKPEYRIYIEKYGPPVNFVFESEKLSAIILELQRKESCTLNYC